MTTIAVLGAGAMGSGLCTPLRAAGWEVNLWGTWLDDHLIDACERREEHPRTGVVLAPGTALFRASELEQALDGASSVVMAVASVGVPEVLRLALPHIGGADALWLTSKGFCPDAAGVVELLPDAIRRIAGSEGATAPPIVAIAGPVKANECAAARPTATVFACRDRSVAAEQAGRTRTPDYAIEVLEDEIGTEVCAPMKNVYAIALGIADGLESASGVPHHNLKAATFARAVREMSLLGAALGAAPETAFGLPGVGDLEVTGLSGRNKVYGERIGRGENSAQALAEMERLEQTVEGVPAAALALDLVAQRTPELADELRLLSAVADIIDGGADPVAQLTAAVLPQS